MTNTLPSKNGSTQRPERSGSESAVGLQKYKRSPTGLGLGLLTPPARSGIPGQVRTASSTQPRPAPRRQGGVLLTRRNEPHLQARSGRRQAPDPAQAKWGRLLRPDPRRRAEDDRPDGRGVRRGVAAPRRPRCRRRRCPSRRPHRQGHRDRRHRDQHPGGLRRDRGQPEHGHPMHSSRRPSRTATWVSRCRSSRLAVSPPR